MPTPREELEQLRALARQQAPAQQPVTAPSRNVQMAALSPRQELEQLRGQTQQPQVSAVQPQAVAPPPISPEELRQQATQFVIEEGAPGTRAPVLAQLSGIPTAETMQAAGTGPAEAALTIATGAIAEPIAGLAGLATLPFADAGKATENIEAVREALTFIPRTPEGMAALQRVAEAVQPIGEAVQAGEAALGEAGFQAAGPIGGAIGETLPTAIGTLVGGGAVRGASRLGGKATTEPTLQAALTKGDVLTTDVFPPTTFVGKSFQKVTERVPFLGTGKVRAAQQKTRVQALDDLAREFDIDPESAFERDIVSSVDKVFKKSQARGGQLRTEAVTELNKLGDVQPRGSIAEINSQIESISKLGARGDAELLATLQNIKGELAGDFERIKDIRTTVFNDISDIGAAKSAIKAGGDAVLTKVAGALSKDLDDFAVNAGKAAGANRELAKAAGKWKASNRIFKDNFAKAKDTELKRALTKGKVQPEVINTTIKGGKGSELKRLHDNLDLKGRESVQQQILKSALEKANGNPTIFLNELNRPNNRKAIGMFFKGKNKRELDGTKKFLDITRRAQEEATSIATQQEVTGLGLIGGAALAPKPVIGAAATIGILGRGFESKAARNMLLKLSNLPAASKKARDIANQLAPLIATSLQAAKPEEQ